MHDTEDVPRPFLVLYSHSLLRVINFEGMTGQGDPTKLLGQIASVLLLITIWIGGAGLLIDPALLSPEARLDFFLTIEHRLIALTLVVVGVFAILSWNSIFPDKRDVMVLGVLPVQPQMLFTAKLAASASTLTMAVVVLNCVSGLTWPIVLHRGGLLGVLASLAAYWLTIVAASACVFCAVLTVQGVLALLFPRKYALRISGLVQIAAFCSFLAVYYLEPSIVTAKLLADPAAQSWLLWSPSYWFLALLAQLNGMHQPAFAALALRAELSLLILIPAAVSIWVLSYFRLMRKIVEVPDILPGLPNVIRLPTSWPSLRKAVLLFSLRSLLRSHQHRVVLAFYLGIGFAVALSTLHLPATVRDSVRMSSAIDLRFLIASVVMLCFAVLGVRTIFAIPVSLPANWIFRVTELRPGASCLRAARTSLLALSVIPTLLGTLVFGIRFQPWPQLATYLVTLGLFGGVLVEVALLRFTKIPFACSQQPGKRNAGFAFWLYLFVVVPITEWSARFERNALQHPPADLLPITILLFSLILLKAHNDHAAASAKVLFDDEPLPELQTLGL